MKVRVLDTLNELFATGTQLFLASRQVTQYLGESVSLEYLFGNSNTHMHSRSNEVSVDYCALMVLGEHMLWVYPTTLMYALVVAYGQKVIYILTSNDGRHFAINETKSDDCCCSNRY